MKITITDEAGNSTTLEDCEYVVVNQVKDVTPEGAQWRECAVGPNKILVLCAGPDAREKVAAMRHAADKCLSNVHSVGDDKSEILAMIQERYG